jgi:hypothetical protein
MLRVVIPPRVLSHAREESAPSSTTSHLTRSRSPNDLLGRFCDRANHIGFTRARRAGTLIVSL